MASENVKVIANIYTIQNEHKRKGLLVFTKKTLEIVQMEEEKYKRSALLYLTEIRYYVSTLIPLMVTFN